jgi:DNA invertase Pin-like site-specific DNA recombinase
MRTAYSYVRFSTPEQQKGDSFRRQTERTADYCAKRGWRFDDTLTLHDLGVRAFRGRNALVGNLRTFLDAIDRGTVKPGSAFIVESVDRITRQGIDEGYDLCKRILKAGVHIVTLCPEREYGPEAVKKLASGALELQLILERAAEESEMKADRIRHAWAKWRTDAAAGKRRPPPGKMPSWMTWNGTAFAPDEGAAAAIGLMFRHAADGLSIRTIVDRLNGNTKGADGKIVHGGPPVAPIGRLATWTVPYVSKLLRSREVLGELTDGGGKVYVGFYPAVVSLEDWNKARGALAARRIGQVGVGRRGVGVANLFSGLVFDAADGQLMHLMNKGWAGRPQRDVRILVSSGALRHDVGSVFASVPYAPLEALFLCFVAELSVKDVAAGWRSKEEDEDAVLAGKEAELTRNIGKAKVLAERDVDAALELLARWDGELKGVRGQREALAARRSQDTAGALREAQGQLPLLRTATGVEREELRAKVKARIKQLVESVWILRRDVSPTIKVAEVQVYLRGGNVRALLLAWAWRGEYPGLAVGIGRLVGEPGKDAHLADKRLYEYRTSRAVRAFFARRKKTMDAAIIQAVEAEIKMRKAVAKADETFGRNDLQKYLSEEALDGTTPPARGNPAGTKGVKAKAKRET